MALIGAVSGLGVLWFAGSAMTRASNTQVADFAPPVLPLRIASTPEISLAGSYWPRRANSSEDSPAILLLHGNGGNRNDVAETADWLHAQGYAVLAIDFRGHGNSTPSAKSFGLREAQDAHAAYAWLRQKHPKAKIGVIGFSLGGAAAVLGSSGPLPADVMVLESVYPDIRHAIRNRLSVHLGSLPALVMEPLLSLQSWPRFGVAPGAISPITGVAKVKAPVMIVGGGNDVYTPPTETQAMFDAAHRNGEMWVLDGLSHDEVVHSAPAAFRLKLLSFLDRHLRPSANAHEKGGTVASPAPLGVQ
jgi:pimeloyl-ACP methyl ester carboxylesterase